MLSCSCVSPASLSCFTSPPVCLVLGMIPFLAVSEVPCFYSSGHQCLLRFVPETAETVMPRLYHRRGSSQRRSTIPGRTAWSCGATCCTRPAKCTPLAATRTGRIPWMQQWRNSRQQAAQSLTYRPPCAITLRLRSSTCPLSRCVLDYFAWKDTLIAFQTCLAAPWLGTEQCYPNTS